MPLKTISKFFQRRWHGRGLLKSLRLPYQIIERWAIEHISKTEHCPLHNDFARTTILTIEQPGLKNGSSFHSFAS